MGELISTGPIALVESLPLYGDSSHTGFERAENALVISVPKLPTSEGVFEVYAELCGNDEIQQKVRESLRANHRVAVVKRDLQRRYAQYLQGEVIDFRFSEATLPEVVRELRAQIQLLAEKDPEEIDDHEAD